MSADRLEDLIARYVDRLVDGESLDLEEIRESHPEIGDELVAEIRGFLELGSNTIGEKTGTTIGDFEIGRQIGRGGGGVVHEAWQHSLDRPVALKLLPASVAGDERTFHRFVREARAAGRLDHPHVVGVYDMGLDGATPFYAMELVEGESLSQVLERIRGDDEAEERDALLIAHRSFGIAYYADLAAAFADVADALEHAHSRGVVHRDIKPSNLILEKDSDAREVAADDTAEIRSLWTRGRLRVLDFGLARLDGQETLTISGDLLGTPAYMTPEQARRAAVEVDHRTDIYSLGATLYEALTLEVPFRGRDALETMSRIVERDPRPPRALAQRVPEDLERIVLHAMEKAPEERYQTAGALAADLRRFVLGDPVEARRPSRWARWRRWALRHRIALGVSAVVLLLLALAVTFAWRLSVERARPREETARATVREYERRVATQAARLLRGEVVRGVGPASGFRGALLVPRQRRPLFEESLDESVTDVATELEAIIALLPDRIEARYVRARALSLTGSRRKALTELDRVLELSPDFAPALVPDCCAPEDTENELTCESYPPCE